jgi:hypothetical protein
MLSRMAKISLWVLCGVLALVVVLGGLLLWRLSAGPMHLSFLTPYLEQALNDSLTGRSAEVQDTVLAWNVKAKSLDLRVNQVTVLDSDGTTLAVFPTIHVRISVWALLRGTVALTTTEIEGARISLTVSPDGTFLFGKGARETTQPQGEAVAESRRHEEAVDLSKILTDIPGFLMSEPELSRPLTFLQRVRLVNGALTVHNQQLGVVWEAPQAAIELRRDRQGLSGKLQVKIAMQDTPADVDANLSYNRDTKQLKLDGSFTDLRAPALAAVVPPLDELAGFDVPFNGSFALSLDLRSYQHGLSFELAGGPGRVSLPGLLPKPLPVSKITTRGRLDPATNTLHLDDTMLAFGTAEAPGPTLSLSASAAGFGGDITAKAEATLRTLQSADLKDYWPQGIGDSIRQRVMDNLIPGTLEQVKADVVLTLVDGKFGTARVESLGGTLRYRLALQKSPASLDAGWSYDGSAKQLDLQASVAALRPSALATAVPALKDLVGLDMPFNGKVALALDAHGKLAKLSFDLSGGPGRVLRPDIFTTPRPLEHVTLRGHLDGAKGTFSLEDGTIVFGTATAQGPIFKISGKAAGIGSDITLDEQVKLENLAVAELKDYWPQNLSAKARAWLTENLTAGTVEQAQVDVAVALPGGDFAAAKLRRLDGTFRYHGIQVHYLRPLPPVIDVNGNGHFDQQGFLIKVEGGTLPDQQVTGGEVKITGLDRNRDAIAIRVGVKTPVRAALNLINLPPLHLLSDFPIDPTTVSGQATVQTDIAFSLIGSVPFDKVDLKVHGTVENVSMQNVVLGQNLENGQLKLAVDKAGMTQEGTVEFAGIPLSFTWKESFLRKTAWRSEMHVSAARLDTAALAKLGLDLTDVVDGPPAATVVARFGWQQQGVVEASLNLLQTRITLPYLGRLKETGEHGTLHGTVQFAAGVGNGSFAINTGTMATSGTLQFDQSQGGLTRLDLRQVVLGDSHLLEIVVRRWGEGYDVAVGEGVLDLEPLVRPGEEAEKNAAQEPADQAAASAASEKKDKHKLAVALHVHAPALQRVYFGDDLYLQDIRVELTHSSAGWELIDIAGEVPESLVTYTPSEQHKAKKDKALPPRTFSLKYQPSSEGIYTLAVHADDLGSMLRACNIDDKNLGGQVSLEGQTAEPRPDASLQTHLEIKDFTVKDVPGLARVLAAASLTDPLSQLNSEGITFTRIFGDLTLADGVVATELLSAHGGGLGITAGGQIDLDAGLLDVQGTLIPLRGINTLLGKIPGLNLLVGGKEQGLIAVTYRAKGPVANPKVSVNPASLVTPGFLRGIFGISSQGETPELPPSAVPPEVSDP